MKPHEARRVQLRIDRLSLDLHGVAPATAEAVARALGPALGAALASRHGHIATADRIDAGRIASPPSPGSHDLATGIARRIVDAAQRGQP